jgi:serine/threonine-protein kinase HipA
LRKSCPFRLLIFIINSKFQIQSSHPFDLLASIGRDCVGAIQLSTEAPVFVKKIQAEALTHHQIATLLKNYQTAPLGMANQKKDFRISIAGAQEKSADAPG